MSPSDLSKSKNCSRVVISRTKALHAWQQRATVQGMTLSTRRRYNRVKRLFKEFINALRSTPTKKGVLRAFAHCLVDVFAPTTARLYAVTLTRVVKLPHAAKTEWQDCVRWIRKKAGQNRLSQKSAAVLEPANLRLLCRLPKAFLMFVTASRFGDHLQMEHRWICPVTHYTLFVLALPTHKGDVFGRNLVRKVVLLPPQWVKRLRQALQDHDSYWTFLSKVKKVSRSASAHSFRTTAVTILTSAGFSEERVATITGHASKKSATSVRSYAKPTLQWALKHPSLELSKKLLQSLGIDAPLSRLAFARKI